MRLLIDNKNDSISDIHVFCKDLRKQQVHVRFVFPRMAIYN